MNLAGGQSLCIWSGTAYRSPAWSRTSWVSYSSPLSSRLRGPLFFADRQPLLVCLTTKLTVGVDR